MARRDTSIGGATSSRRARSAGGFANGGSLNRRTVGVNSGAATSFGGFLWYWLFLGTTASDQAASTEVVPMTKDKYKSKNKKWWTGPDRSSSPGDPGIAGVPGFDESPPDGDEAPPDLGDPPDDDDDDGGDDDPPWYDPDGNPCSHTQMEVDAQLRASASNTTCPPGYTAKIIDTTPHGGGCPSGTVACLDEFGRGPWGADGDDTGASGGGIGGSIGSGDGSGDDTGGAGTPPQLQYF